MALGQENNTQLESLVGCLAGHDQKVSNLQRFKALRDSAYKKLRTHRTTSINQFDVKKRYDGLHERFIVLNREDLAEALTKRLDRLSQLSNPLTPEFLTLLLHLSDKPANKSKVGDLNHLNHEIPTPQITWKEIIEDDPLDETGVWDDIDYAAESDVESILEVQSKSSASPRKRTRSPVPSQPADFDIPVIYGDSTLLTAFRQTQFWNLRPGRSLPEGTGDDDCSSTDEDLIMLSELQAVRECLFMLQGLPTAIFERPANPLTWTVSRKFSLAHITLSRFRGILASFAVIGNQLEQLRSWTTTEHSLPLTQAFQNGIRMRMRDLCRFFGHQEDLIVQPQAHVTISLTALHKVVAAKCRLLQDLTAVIARSGLYPGATQPPYEFLELLYEESCVRKSILDSEGFEFFQHFFFECLKFYLLPLQKWMRFGELPEENNLLFIEEVTVKDSGTDQMWWKDHFRLRLSEQESILAPAFIHGFTKVVLTTGKSVVFLQKLGISQYDLVTQEGDALDLEATCSDLSSDLVPFSEEFRLVLDDWIRVQHHSVSKVLRKTLGESCDLWACFEALEHIYLGRNGFLLQELTKIIFSKMDKGKAGWNDSYLLTEWAQSIFSTNSCINTDMLSIKFLPGAYGDSQSKRRTVKVLDRMVFRYDLPWSISNIVQQPAIKGLQKVSTLLVQILRSKYVLEQVRILKQLPTPNEDPVERALVFRIRHSLLWFSNSIYLHLTETVIEPLCKSMKQEQVSAADLEEMVLAYEKFVKTLESRCFTTKKLAPIRQAITSLLDLSILFTDVHASQTNQRNFESTNLSSTFQASRFSTEIYRRRTRHRDSNSSSDEDESDEEDIDTSHISFAEAPYLTHLKKINASFEQLHQFILSGICSVHRVSADPTWEILMQRLEGNMPKRALYSLSGLNQPS
ncbi:MAG: hypothetical protein M1814_002910 [Vezdaea aestivalis]|nr:MAG: hypothetical protein M1814_002910 [Vezdaea aestivalis]